MSQEDQAIMNTLHATVIALSAVIVLLVAGAFTLI